MNIKKNLFESSVVNQYSYWFKLVINFLTIGLTVVMISLIIGETRNRIKASAQTKALNADRLKYKSALANKPDIIVFNNPYSLLPWYLAFLLSFSTASVALTADFFNSCRNNLKLIVKPDNTVYKNGVISEYKHHTSDLSASDREIKNLNRGLKHYVEAYKQKDLSVALIPKEQQDLNVLAEKYDSLKHGLAQNDTEKAAADAAAKEAAAAAAKEGNGDRRPSVYLAEQKPDRQDTTQRDSPQGGSGPSDNTGNSPTPGHEPTPASTFDPSAAYAAEDTTLKELHAVEHGLQTARTKYLRVTEDPSATADQILNAQKDLLKEQVEAYNFAEKNFSKLVDSDRRQYMGTLGGWQLVQHDESGGVSAIHFRKTLYDGIPRGSGAPLDPDHMASAPRLAEKEPQHTIEKNLEDLKATLQNVQGTIVKNLEDKCTNFTDAKNAYDNSRSPQDLIKLKDAEQTLKNYVYEVNNKLEHMWGQIDTDLAQCTDADFVSLYLAQIQTFEYNIKAQITRSAAITKDFSIMPDQSSALEKVYEKDATALSKVEAYAINAANRGDNLKSFGTIVRHKLKDHTPKTPKQPWGYPEVAKNNSDQQLYLSLLDPYGVQRQRYQVTSYNNEVLGYGLTANKTLILNNLFERYATAIAGGDTAQKDSLLTTIKSYDLTDSMYTQWVKEEFKLNALTSAKDISLGVGVWLSPSSLSVISQNKDLSVVLKDLTAFGYKTVDNTGTDNLNTEVQNVLEKGTKVYKSQYLNHEKILISRLIEKTDLKQIVKGTDGLSKVEKLKEDLKVWSADAVKNDANIAHEEKALDTTPAGWHPDNLHLSVYAGFIVWFILGYILARLLLYGLDLICNIPLRKSTEQLATWYHTYTDFGPGTTDLFIEKYRSSWANAQALSGRYLGIFNLIVTLILRILGTPGVLLILIQLAYVAIYLFIRCIYNCSFRTKCVKSTGFKNTSVVKNKPIQTNERTVKSTKVKTPGDRLKR